MLHQLKHSRKIKRRIQPWKKSLQNLCRTIGHAINVYNANLQDLQTCKYYSSEKEEANTEKQISWGQGMTKKGKMEIESPFLTFKQQSENFFHFKKMMKISNQTLFFVSQRAYFSTVIILFALTSNGLHFYQIRVSTVFCSALIISCILKKKFLNYCKVRTRNPHFNFSSNYLYTKVVFQQGFLRANWKVLSKDT